MVLGPNHCTPVNKNGHSSFRFLVAKHVFLNECTVFVANFSPEYVSTESNKTDLIETN
jgi:hypothetical protein